MRFVLQFLLAAAFSFPRSGHAADNASSIGYDCAPTCIPSNLNSSQLSNLSFGQHYAVLNLDLITGIVSNVANTTQGKSFISNTAKWICAVHALSEVPLTIFTRIYFLNSRRPEIKPGSAFEKLASQFGNASDPKTQIYSAFEVDPSKGDLVLRKDRYYAGAGNELEQILAAQSIDTVILSGIRTSGVILATAYRLYDLDYKVYIIANNTIEPGNSPDIYTNILEGIAPKLPVNVITIEQAIAALKRSGPAIY